MPHPSLEERANKSLPPTETPAAAESLKRLSRSGLKKVSKARVLASMQRFSAAPLWQGSGLGVSSADGCIALEKIDVQTPDDEIREAMVSILHDPQHAALAADLLAEGGSESGVHHETCQAKCDICCQDPNRELCDKYVADVHRKLAAGELSSGSLFEFKTRSPAVNQFYFIGCSSSKPKGQVMMQGFRATSEGHVTVSCVDPASGRPKMLTSHAMFSDVLRMVGPAKELPIELFAWVPCKQDMLQVRLLTATPTAFASARPRPQPKRKATPTLPFGLTARARPARPNRHRHSRPKAEPKQVQKPPVSLRSLIGGSALNEILLSSSSAEHVDEAESESLESVEILEDAPDGNGIGPVRMAAYYEEVAPENAGPADAAPTDAAPADAAPTDAAPVSAPAARRSTRCNASLGIIGVSTQLASRLATCRHCLLKVRKNEARFAYSWNVSKFESYLHAACVLPHLLQEESSIEQAIEYLTRWQVGSAEKAAPHVVQTVAEVLSTLRQQ